MDFMLSIVFELGSNLIESFLFFYLISHCLKLKYNKNNKYLLLIIEFIIITTCNLTITSTLLRIIILLFTDCILTFIFTNGNYSERFFWGTCYSLITLISERFILFSYSCLFKQNVADLFQSSLNRYLSVLLYLIFCFLFVLIIVHTRKYTLVFPSYLMLIFLIIILIGIITSERILSTFITLHTFALTDSSLTHSLYQIGIAFMIALLLLFFVMIYTGILYKRNLTLLEKQKLTQIDQHQFKILSETNQFLRTWKHENTNHLLTCLELLKSENYPDCQKYLSGLIQEINYANWSICTGNHVIDSVISIKLISIKDAGILFKHKIFLPDAEYIPLSGIHLSSLLGNALDNAIEACKKIKSPTVPYISLTIKSIKSTLLIEIKNSSINDYQYSTDGQLITTKLANAEHHGIGLNRITSIVTEVGGFYTITPSSDCFTLTLVLPLNIERKSDK